MDENYRYSWALLSELEKAVRKSHKANKAFNKSAEKNPFSLSTKLLAQRQIKAFDELIDIVERKNEFLDEDSSNDPNPNPSTLGTVHPIKAGSESVPEVPDFGGVPSHGGYPDPTSRTD